MNKVFTLFFVCAIALVALLGTGGCRTSKKTLEKVEESSASSFHSVASSTKANRALDSLVLESDMLSRWESFIAERLVQAEREIVVESISTSTDSAGSTTRQEQRSIIRSSDVKQEVESHDEYSQLIHTLECLYSEIDSLKKELLAVSKTNTQRASEEAMRKTSRPWVSVSCIGAALLAISLLLMLVDWLKERKKGKKLID